jgi:uncharacterized protein (TIGR02246 family)
MEVWELAARESIRDLVARYNASGDSGRFDETMALFADDAVVEVVPGRTYTGPDEIRSLFAAAAKTNAPESSSHEDEPRKRRFVRHYTATHQIDVLGPDEARGRSYYAVLTESGLDHWGRYVDRYVRRDGHWMFHHRHITVDASVPGGWAERSTADLRDAR